MKPVVLPMLHLLRRRKDGKRLTRDIRLGAAAYSQHSLEFVRKNFDEPGQHVRPILENPPSSPAAGEFKMAQNQLLHDLRILRFAARLKNDRLQIYGFQIASLLGKVHLLVEDIRDTAAH